MEHQTTDSPDTLDRRLQTMENSGAIGPVSTPPGLTEDAEVIDCDVPDIINVNERFEMVDDDKAHLCCSSCEEEEWIQRNCDCSENIIERDGDENQQ